MKRSSSTDAKIIDRFLRTQRFRDQETPRIYGLILRAFLGFVSEHAEGALLSVSILQQWIQERVQKWPIHMVIHRARLVERFLEWSQSLGLVDTNPFAELHRHYGSHTAPIVRALASSDVEAALRLLRPAERFGSFLGKLMEEHVTLMRSLGYRYHVNEGMLLRFDRFLQIRGELTGEPMITLIHAWAKSDPSPNQLREALKVGRLISKAMHRLDPKVAILPTDSDMYRQARQLERRPHQHSDEEIQRLFQAALSFPSPKAPLRPISLYTMVVLGYCAALRVGEIVALNLADVDLQDDTIEIRESKFFKHRRLPLPPGVMAALKAFLSARQQAGASMCSESGLFWNQRLRQRYSYGGIRLLLVEVLRRAGLKPARGRVGPRIHDYRHSMVGHRMRNWYQEGVNPQSKLPYLAAYLGHKNIESTLVYINPTPELLHEASERFRKTGAAILRTTGDTP